MNTQDASAKNGNAYPEMTGNDGVNNNKGKSAKQNRYDTSLMALLAIMAFGLFAIILVCCLEGKDGCTITANIGLEWIVALASLSGGGFMGFLFGIPRSLQRSDNERPAQTETIARAQSGESANNEVKGVSVSSNTHKEQPYSNNTNLQQISDWLTKIIVGVGLTQFRSIQTQFNETVKTLSNGLMGVLHGSSGFAFTSTVIIFYVLCGFLTVYLWAKLYLKTLLTLTETDIDDILNEVKKQSSELHSSINDEMETLIKKQALKLELNELKGKLNEFHKMMDMINTAENKDGISAVLAAAHPEPITYLDDCQKGRWGGNPESGGYILHAKYELTNRESVYECTFTVEPSPQTSTKQLNGKVYFFLHDSYFPDCVMIAESEGNKASIVVHSYEAFTVGAVCCEGTVKLELDSNLDASAPGPPYKYQGPLETFDQINLKYNAKEKELSALDVGKMQ